MKITIENIIFILDFLSNYIQKNLRCGEISIHVDAVWRIYLSRKSFAFVGNFSNPCKSHYNCVHFEVMVYIERDSLQLMQTCKNFIQ